MKNYKKISIPTVLILVFTILLIVGSLQTTFAANKTIDANTEGDIRGAITNTSVNSGDTIYLQSGTYNKTGNDTNFTISKNITLQGNGSTDSVIINAQGLSRIFTIGNNLNVKFINITFTNAYTTGNGGAIHNNYAGTMMTFINCTFTNNENTARGSAIYDAGSTNLTIFGCNFVNNTGGDVGSTVHCRGSNAIINDSNFINNSGSRTLYFVNGQNISIYSCSFINNNGGAVQSTILNLTITKSNFINNTAADRGGAIYNTGSGLAIIDSNFTDNFSGGYGGAIHTTGGAIVDMIRCNFINNTAGSSGGAFNVVSSLLITINDCNFINNYAGNNGGAIAGDGNPASGNGSLYTILVSNSTFRNNMADFNGGVIHNNGNMSLSGNTMANNSAKILGNMIYNNGNIGILNLTYLSNSTLKTSKSSNVTVYAILTDDMGNTVTGQNISFYVDGVFIANVTSIEGKANTTYLVTKGPVSLLPVTGDYTGHDGYSIVLKSGELLVPKIPTNITVGVPGNLKVGENTTIESKLIDKDGNPIVNATVDFYVDGKKIGSAVTDENGVARLNHTFNKAGNPIVTAKFAGDSTYIASNVTNQTIVSKIKTNLELETDNETITATLTDEDGNPLANKEITITVDEQTFVGTTDSNGQVIIKFSNANRYKVTANFPGDNQYAPSSATVLGESEPTEPTSDIPVSGKAAMKSTGVPLNILFAIAILGIIAYRRKQ